MSQKCRAYTQATEKKACFQISRYSLFSAFSAFTPLSPSPPPYTSSRTSICGE